MPQNGFVGRGKKLPPRNLNQALYACQIPDRQGQQKRGGVEPWGGNRGPPGAGGAARGRKGSNPDVLPQARISVAMLKGTPEKFVAVGFKPESTKFVSAHASSPIPDRSGSDKSPVWAGSARPWWSSHAGTWASVLCRSGHRRQTHERSVHCRLWWGHAHASSHTSFDTPARTARGPNAAPAEVGTALLMQSFQQLSALTVLQTPIGSLPLQQLADRARDLGSGEKPERRSVHRKFSTNIRSLPGT